MGGFLHDFRLPPVVALALLAAASCARPPVVVSGFSADTATRDGLISGAVATEPGCLALPDGLWVRAGKRAECLRYAAGGPLRGARTAIVYIPGDPGGAAYRAAGGLPLIEAASETYELSDEARHASAEARSGGLGGVPVVIISRPGMQGASGDHARDRHTQAEIELVDGALDALRSRFGMDRLVLLGFSSGGAVVANLLARRGDVSCAVIGSAPLDLAQYYRRPDGTLPDIFALRANELADPMRSVGSIRPGAEIWVIGDRRDRLVPATAWDAWVKAARAAGLHVHAAEVVGHDRPDFGGNGQSRHLTISRGFEVAKACAEGMPPDRLLHALQADAPLLAPKGRRLGGDEIRSVLAGQQLRGLEWQPVMNLLARFGADGTLTTFSLGREPRPIAEQRWNVEGGRLCTTHHGCGELLADRRFLHLMSGHPPRLRLTLIVPP